MEKLINRIATKKAALETKINKLQENDLVESNINGDFYGAWENEIQFMRGEIQGLEDALRLMTPPTTSKDLAAELFAREN